MLSSLKLWNFSAGTLPSEELCPSTFVLSTCQRTIVLAFDRYPFKHQALPKHDLYTGEAAYLFLLETICGLKSKLIGENEIVGQFKAAYKLYAASTLKDNKLLIILEKLFQDAKDIRTQYLIGISQKTYASLTRKHLIQRMHARQVVILGSGQLAEDLINQLKKKAEVFLCARNSERVQELAKFHQLQVIPWEERNSLINYPFIANSIGNKCVLFGEEFFEAWSQQEKCLWVDLGSPSVIRTDLTLSEGIVRLEDIFKEGAIVEGQKLQQIELAREAMLNITHKRKSLLEAKLNRTQNVLPPQITADVRYL